ncbi:MAG: S1 RNA-binding domain-containing protein [Chloroflexi bacterium]|nr:S1 RNA-binding domain-containing protein [Chloroflexota bacterium]
MENTDIVEVPHSTEIKRKQHYTGTVVKTTLAGAIVDIGLGVPGVVHISRIQEAPVRRVDDVLQVGQVVDVWVHRAPSQKGRIELTMIKPLDLEWRELKKDMVLKGKVVRLEKFGAFVEIGAERPGLVHISELTHDYIKEVSEVVKEGDEVEVKVLDVDRKKKQIKLSMKALEMRPEPVAKASKGGAKEKEAEPEVEQPVPTAMEAALREAMERSRESRPVNAKTSSKSRPDRSRRELENILSRTLDHKSRTSKQ